MPSLLSKDHLLFSCFKMNNELYFRKQLTGGSFMAEAIRIGDIITTRRPHPCGGNEWTVTRTGADVKMRCNTCGHIVMLDREKFLQRRKALIQQGPES